jgi:hypothetical protein
MPTETPAEGKGDTRFRVRAASPVSSRPMPGGPGLGGRRGVPLSIPLPFLLTGACAAALFALLAPWILPLALQTPAFPQVLALVHLVTLGWLTMTIMGASLQLAPVIVVAPLRATMFVRWQYPLFLVGVLCLIAGFWFWQTWLLITGGTLVVLAVAQYGIILSITFTRASTRPLTVRFLIASLVYLCLVVSLGLTLACNFATGFLGTSLEHLLLLHVTLGVVGWLSCTLIGVSYTLGRLFSLAHTHDDRWGKRIWFILNGGIIVLAAGEVLDWPLVTWGGGLVLILAAGLFAADFWRMLRARQRKKLEVTQYHSIAATGYFGVVIGVGAVLLLMGQATPAVFTALGLAALVGWLGQSTVGYLYKIVPFLVWSERYGPLVGTRKVPLMRDLVHEQWAWISWWLLNGSLPVMIGATLAQQVIVLQVAGGELALGLCLVLANLLRATFHLRAGQWSLRA